MYGFSFNYWYKTWKNGCKRLQIHLNRLKIKQIMTPLSPCTHYATLLLNLLKTDVYYKIFNNKKQLSSKSLTTSSTCNLSPQVNSRESLFCSRSTSDKSFRHNHLRAQLSGNNRISVLFPLCPTATGSMHYDRNILRENSAFSSQY